MKSIKIIDTNAEFEFKLLDRSHGTIIRSLEGWEFPTTRPVIDDLPTTDGALYVTSKFGRRNFAFSGYLVNDCLEKRRELVSTMHQGRLKTLTFTTLDDLELQASVEITNLLNPYTQMTKPLMIEMVAPDYRFYSQALQSSVTGTTRLIGGTPIPTAIPLSLAVTSGSNKLVIINNGHTKSPATFTITGPGTDFIIQNQTTGEILNLNLTLLANETVTITSNIARKGANQNVYGSVTGTRWQVAPGSNTVHFDALSGSDGNTSLKIEYRHAYLGV
jgi:hypothetical protein